MWTWNQINTDWWSISSSVILACARPWVLTRYSSTQVTRWSLNVPLISWCRMSGAISSWMSALGKSFVKGWKDYEQPTAITRMVKIPQGRQPNHIHPIKRRAPAPQQVSPYAPDSKGHNPPHQNHEAVMYTCEKQQFRSARMKFTVNSSLTLHTNPVQHMWEGPALGSQQCMVQSKILYVGNVHLGNAKSQVLSCLVAD